MKSIIASLLLFGSFAFAGDLGTFSDGTGRKASNSMRIYYVEGQKVVLQAFRSTTIFDQPDQVRANTYFSADGSSVEYLDDESFIYQQMQESGEQVAYFLKRVKSCK